MGRGYRPWWWRWWRGAFWQLCREKIDPPLLPPQTKGLSFWVCLGRLLAGMERKNGVVKAELWGGFG